MNLITILIQIVAYVFFIIGSYFLLSTAVGMIRFPDLYTRLHAGSKCLIAGGISVLIGCILVEGISFDSLKLIIMLTFLLLTNPIATHVIVRLSTNFDLVSETISENDIDK
ncbi:monovalent cation/H(+) antiporter subunit G [Bacillus luteolus]|uniref:Monovalent cation/H(+) antiporter subunit G n=1 Tax=Litchfieldia luteola TaxID=682179 RepID=A0ABR9QDB3_9BACI|nr:monovalent cation/H(+) antiporter subunit G [Cytobacillus luteolus]